MNHEIIQSYFDKLYSHFENDIKQITCISHNELYGELYYYSVVKLLKYLNITDKDHVLDIGSGVGKIVFQIFMTTKAVSVTGIEINNNRSIIANKIKDIIFKQLPELFNPPRYLNLINGDFLNHDFNNISIIYVCSTVFSLELLNAIGKKINTMNNVEKIISFRQLSNLNHFQLTKKIFVHGDWDYAICYLYVKIPIAIEF